MTNDTARILASCLDAIEHQGWSLEECIARHPDQRVALRELLPVAQALQAAPAVIPSLDFRMDARQRLLARLPARRSRLAKWVPRRVVAARVSLMLLMGATLTTSVVTASAQALPNDALYPVKRTIELVRLAFAADHVRGGDLRLVFAAERLVEVERLADMGRGADAAGAIDDFATEMQSVVSITQTMPDTIERAALIARVAESIRSSDAVLATTQAYLPESAQVAVIRVRTLLAERADDLHGTPLPVAPTIAASTTPDRTLAQHPTPSLPGPLPAAIPTIPAVRPTLIWRPTDLPAHRSTPQPRRRPNIELTEQPPHVLPDVKPTRLPPVIATFEPPHLNPQGRN